jgi:hypothetical protein
LTRTLLARQKDSRQQVRVLPERIGLLSGTSNMLFTIAVVLIILWLLGLVTSYTLGGFIHILLVVAIIVILIRVINGRSL